MAKEQVAETSDLSQILPFLLKSFFPQKTSESGSESTVTGANIGPLLQLLQQMNPDLVAQQAQAGVNFQTDRLLQNNFAPYLAAVNASGGYNTGNQFLAQLISDTAGQGAKLATDARLEAGKTSEAAARDVATNTKQTNTSTQKAQVSKASPDLASIGTTLLLSMALKKAGSTVWDKLTASEAGPEQLSGPAAGDSSSLGGIAEGHGGVGSSDAINSSIMTDQAFGAPTAAENAFAPEVIPAAAFANTPEEASAAIEAANVSNGTASATSAIGLNSELTPAAQNLGITSVNQLPESGDDLVLTKDENSVGDFSPSSEGDIVVGGSQGSEALVGSAGEDVSSSSAAFSSGEGAGAAEGVAGGVGSAVAGVGVIDLLSGGSLSHDYTTDQDYGPGAQGGSQIDFTSYARENTDPGALLVSNEDIGLGENNGIENTLESAPGDVYEAVSDASVVCTEALKQEYMTYELYKEAHRKIPGQQVMNGYHYVAMPIVLKMRKDKEFAKVASNWAVKYCEYTIGKKKSYTGFVLYWIARPVCFVIGYFVGSQPVDEVLYG